MVCIDPAVCECVWGGGGGSLGDKHVGGCPGKWAGGMFSAVIICIMDFLFRLFSNPVCPFIISSLKLMLLKLS